MSFPMDLKVVKVGDIDPPLEEQIYLVLDAAPSESNVELPEKGGAPDNWPQIPQLSRPRSCVTCGERTNCVNKAVEHLQLLSDILTDWIQTPKDKLPEDTDDTDANQTLSICDVDPTDKEGALVPLPTDLGPFRSIDTLKDYNSHSHLRSVVKEVMSLLAWLHDDCQKTEDMLHSETASHARLSQGMEEMTRQKVTDLQNAVQQEHDSLNSRCRVTMEDMMDLNEIRAAIKRKLKSKRLINFHLRKQLSFRNEKIPLVHHKMVVEKGNIDVIQNALNEAEEKMDEALKYKPEAESKYNKSLEIAHKEEFLINQQLNCICHELNVLCNAAETTERNFYLMGTGIVQGGEEIEENKRSLLELSVKLENHKSASHAMKIESEEKKRILVEQLRIRIANTADNEKLEATLLECNAGYNLKQSELVDSRLKLEEELNALLDTNYYKRHFIESSKVKTEVSKKHKLFFDQSALPMAQEITKIENQIGVTSDKLRSLQEGNILLLEALERAQQKVKEQEEYLSRIIVTIGDKIDHENNVYMELVLMVENLEVEVQIAEAELVEKKKKINLKVDNAKGRMPPLEEKITNLNAQMHKQNQELVKLDEEKKRLKGKHEQERLDNEAYLKNLEPCQQVYLEKCEAVEIKMGKLLEERDRMTREIEILMKEINGIKEDIEKTQEEIQKRRDITEEPNFKLEVANKLWTDTNTRWEQANERVNQEEKEYAALMDDRKETLEEVLQKKEENLKLNGKLASNYSISETNLEKRKMEFVKLSEDTFLLEQAIKNMRQVRRLQIKVHRSSKTHLKYRGNCQRQALAHFVNLSEVSQNRVKHLQSQFNSKIKTITTNLSEIMSDMFKENAHFLPMINQDVLPKINQLTS